MRINRSICTVKVLVTVKNRRSHALTNPAGLPAWMRELDGSARRVGKTDKKKRGNITIAPEDEPYVRLCQLCGREEATKKLVIYVCTPHADVARPEMQKLLADLKAKVDKEISSIEEEVITTG